MISSVLFMIFPSLDFRVIFCDFPSMSFFSSFEASLFLDGLFNLFNVILADFILHPFPVGFTCFCIFYSLISFFLFQQFEFFLRKFFCFGVCFFPCALCDGVRDFLALYIYVYFIMQGIKFAL